MLCALSNFASYKLDHFHRIFQYWLQPHSMGLNQAHLLFFLSINVAIFQKSSEFFKMSSSGSISFNSREESIDTPTENLPESISNEVCLPTPRQKRGRTADSTWDKTRKRKPSEPERGRKRRNLIYYYKHCDDYSTYVSTTFRLHLSRVVGLHRVSCVTRCDRGCLMFTGFY